ncbi:MAG: fibronectin type III domain-containing protein, partial [Bacteroidales bacterium]|nr:fibronectin type III domain-containing protein [Bacteroidales bacterium]
MNTGYARDTLRVYARTSSTGTWILVQTLSDELSVWTKQSIDLTAYGTGNLQLAFEFVYGAGLGIGIDNVRLGDASVCYTPNNLQAYRITNNSAELMWTAYESAFQYGLKVSTTSLSDPSSATANVFDGTVYYKPYAVTGLQPSTTYYYYVSADCGNGDVSSWSVAGQFTTQCAAVNLPYNVGFETSSDFATCWTKNFTANGEWTTTPSASTYAPKTSSNAAATGASGLSLYGYYYSYNSTERSTMAWVATPEINVSSLTTRQISFQAKASTSTATLHVGIMSDVDDAATFEEVVTINNLPTGNFQEYVIPLSSILDTTAKHIAFMVDGMDNEASEYIYIDDVIVEDVPLCPRASMVAANAVTGNDANITWLGVAPLWNVKVSTTALANPATDTANFLTTTTTSSPFHLSGLTPKTTYYVYLQPDCSSAGNGVGAWSNEMSFSTTQVVATVPYNCDFEDSEANQWEIVSLNSGSNNFVVGSGVNNGGSKALYISSDGTSYNYNINSSSASNAYRSIKVNPGVYAIDFDWQCNGETGYDYLKAYLTPSTFVPAGTSYSIAQAGWIDLTSSQMVAQTGWQHVTYILNVSDTTVYNLLFSWKNDASMGSNPPAAVDNISITPYTCAAPTALTANNITTSSFTIGWTASALGETAWDVFVYAGTDTIANTTVTTNSYTVTGMSPSTTYTVRVRSNCGAGDVSAWNSTTVMTSCGAVTTLPYTETFSNYGTGTGTYPACWSNNATSTSSIYIVSYNDATGDGVGSLFSNNEFAVTPMFNVASTPMSNMVVRFNAIAISSTSVVVGVVSDLNDISNSFTPCDTVTVLGTTGSLPEYIASLASSNATSGAIAFLPIGQVFIDDVVVEERPSCMPTTNLTVSNIQTDNVTLSWNCDASVTSWDVAYGTAGFNPDSVPANPITITTNPYTLTGLTAGTMYNVYVRSNCGNNSYSSWVGVSFTTMALPGTIPYSCGFEASESESYAWDLLSNSANSFVVGTGAANTGSQALYISNDGINAGYSTSSSSYAYALRTVVFPAGVYDISYTWRSYGEAGFDYGRAFIVPMSVALNISSSSGISQSNIPAGWTALDGSNQLSISDSWSTQTTRYFVTQQDTVRLLFYWRNDASDGSSPALCIDNVSITPVTGCLDPVVSATTQNGVTSISWIESDSATYHVLVSETSISNPSGATASIDTVVSASPLQINGLQSSSVYYVYVQAICNGNDSSAWKNTSFTTPCAPIRSVNETFATTEMPLCWTSGSNVSSTPVSIVSGHAHTGSYSARLNGGGTIWLASPAIMGDIAETQANFWVEREDASSSGELVVGVMSDPSNISTFVPVDTIIFQSDDVMEQKSVNFSGVHGMGNSVAFVQYNTSGYWFWLDDIEIGEFRQCQQPSNVAVANLSTTGANVSWNANNGLSFTVVVTTTSVDPDSVSENDPNVVFYLDQLTSNSVDLTGELSPATTYYIYVQSDCNSTDGKLSFWSDEFVFSTLCYAVNVPFVENFNGTGSGVNVMPTCWTSVVGSNNTLPAGNNYDPYIVSGLTTPDNDSRALRLYGYYQNGVADSKGCAVMPLMATNIDTLMLSFSHKSESDPRRMLVGLMSDPSDLSTFTPIDTAYATSTWTRQIVRLIGHNAGNYIAFLVDGDLNQATTTIYLDSVVVDTVQSCMAPLHFVASNITGYSATFDVQTLSNTDSRVQIQIATSTASTEAAIDSITFVADTIVNVADLPVTINGLQPLTSYYAFARVVCGNNSYTSRVVTNFTTDCGRFSVPFAESFNEAQGLPTCWSADGSTPTITNLQAVSGKSLYINDDVIVELPELDIQGSVNSYALSFSYYTTAALATIEAGIMNVPGDTSSFVSMGVVNATSSAWTNFEANFANYTGTAKNIAFRINNGIVYVDDVYFGPSTSCARPTALTTTLVDTASISLTWTAGGSETSWDVIYCPTGADIANYTPVAVTTNSYNITGLMPATRYDVYVRSNCGGSDGVSAYSKVTVRTAIVAESLPLTSTFETPSDVDAWEIATPFGTNQWFIGNFGNPNTGLYVSNDNGASNSYSTSVASLSYARRLFRTEGGDLQISFDWRNVGESNYDFIRVFLVPENEDMTTALPAYNTIGIATQPSSFIPATSSPTYFSLQSTWQHYEGAVVNVPFGNYYLMVVWRNDGSAGSMPPGAVDNISLDYRHCYVSDITVNKSSNSATINASTDCATVRLQMHDSTFTAGADSIMLDTIVTLPVTINNLLPQTEYYLTMRGYCTNGDSTNWTAVTMFKTKCTAVEINDSTNYVCGFEEYTHDAATNRDLPDCWETWTDYTSYYPYVYSTHHDGSYGLYFYATASTKCLAASPEISGLPLGQVQLDFYGYSPYTAAILEVGYMTDPSDNTTFVKLEEVSVSSSYTWEHFLVSLAGAPATAKHFAFRLDPTSYYSFNIDDITASKAPDCAQPGLSASVNGNNIALTISAANPTDTEWEVIVTTGATPDTIGAIYADTVTTTSLNVVANYSTTYNIFARTVCGGGEASTWKQVSASTPCGIIEMPYTEAFNSFPPACWRRANKLLANVLNGTETITDYNGGWNTTTGNGLTTSHPKINIYGSTCKYWLITPSVFVDTIAVLSFDLALTDYDNGDPIEDNTAQADDRFVVIVSRDGGNTWTSNNIVAEWNNTGSSRVFNNIAYNGEHVELSLGNYVGDTIIVAFYGESTAAGGDNDLHIDNVAFNSFSNVINITDNICDGYNYVGNGFNIASADITPTTNTFTRLSADTMFVLTLNIMPSVEVVFNDTICSGTTYTLNGFNTNTAGTYHRYLTTAVGCDSIITLNLVVNQGFSDTQSLTICQNQTPYMWHGQSLTTTGQYTHTAAGTTGCDSVWTLNLTVTQAINTTVNDAICQGDTYTWNGQNYTAAGTYTWTGTSAAGCDSIVTLNLTVNPVYNINQSITLENYEVPYSWNGMTIDSTGIYTWYGTTAAG